MDRGVTQIDKTLQLIRNGFSPKTKEETQLLNDLRRELVLCCRNLEEGNANCEVADTITKSLSLFSKNISESPSNNNTPTTTHTANNQDSNNGITSSIINGTLLYFLDGKQIKFKVFKNKPKNGDFEVRWNRNLEELKQFKYGTTRVTRSTPGHKELGNWVAEQRRKLKKGKITQKQFEVLNDLEFEWDRSSYFYNTYKQKDTVDKEEEEDE